MAPTPLSTAEVRQTVEQNAAGGGMADARIYVASDQFGGFVIRVVHELLQILDDDERKDVLLRGLSSISGTFELLTPSEEEWYGPPFIEDLDDLPSWPEALRKESKQDQVLFASDLDREVDTPAVVTFYSLRGGVGRSTALAAAARALAARGRRVLCIDMDFEAPGLSFLFGLREPLEDKGSLSLLLSLEGGNHEDIRDHIQRVSETDELYCLPAGRLGVAYAERLRLLDPEAWYREANNPLHKLLDLAKSSTISPEVILIDSRTGISPVSAPLLFDASDLAVVCFFPHPQARRGTELLVYSLLNAKSRRSTEEIHLSPEPRFLISPVPSGPSAAAVRTRAAEWIDEWMVTANLSRTELGPLAADELMHVVSYSADIAFRDFVDGSSPHDPVYGPVADWLEQLLPPKSVQLPSTMVDKKQVLTELDFSTGTAEHQNSFFDDYVQTRVSLQAMADRYPLVIGRKGTGKTAIFRWLLERSPAQNQPIPVFCPHPFRNKIHWALGAEGFALVESRFSSQDNWRTFWACYCALATYLSNRGEIAPPDRFDLDYSIFEDAYGELEVVEALNAMMRNPAASLAAVRWLQDVDRRRKSSAFLLFDGLDTGFGNDSEGRKRRSRAVTGLLTFLTEVESRLTNLPFKVMLRFDIWQQLKFENKSHLYGRYVQLTWRDPDDYFKTALKQASRSSGYRELLAASGVSTNIDSWGEDEVRQGWNLLVGERMKGGKTTFTRNWVWNRLSDGQGDHGPRALSQLFHQAVDWERREEARNSYDRSILRPRALVPSLDAVSDEALAALVEEFPELVSLIDTLREIGRTPLDALDVQRANETAAEALDLALEVGLLAIYEGTHDEIRRYRVPDLFRVALGMTRKGQA